MDKLFVIVILYSLTKHAGSLRFVLKNERVVKPIDDGKDLALDFSYTLDSGDSINSISFSINSKKFALIHSGKEPQYPSYVSTADKQNIKINVDEKTFVVELILKQVIYTKENDRIYGCEVDYSTGTSSKIAKSTIAIKVLQKPAFKQALVKFRDSVEGDRLTIPCSASGIPSPKIAWSKVGSNESLTHSGSFLELLNINRTQSGNYTCSATNEAGTKSFTTVVQVQYKPEINKTASPTRVKSFVDNPNFVQLRCIADGVPEPKIEWVTPEGNKPRTPILNLKNLKERQFGKYICWASNKPGDVNFIVVLERIYEPDPPSSVILKSREQRSVLISIKPPIARSPPDKKSDNINADLKWIIVSFIHRNGTFEKRNLTPSTRDYWLEGLTPYTEYVVNVTVKNIFLSSKPFNITVRTTEAIPGPPSNVSLSVRSSSEVIATWQHPTEPNGLITEYKYYVFRADDESKYNASGSVVDKTSIVISKLTVYTQYSFKVRAVNLIGNGVWSPVVKVTTDPGAPSQPLNFTANVLGGDKIKLKWNAPSYLGGAEIMFYDIRFSVKHLQFPNEPDEILNYKITPQQTIGRQHVLQVASYSIVRVWLREGSGTKPIWGSFAGPIEKEIKQGVPGSPKALEVIGKTSEQIHLRWLPPDHINGILLRFSVVYKAIDMAIDIKESKEVNIKDELSNKTFFYTITNLKAATKYRISVYCHNEDRKSIASVLLEVSTAATGGNNAPASAPEEDGSDTGAIVGGVISVLLILCIGILIFIYIKKRKVLRRPVSQSSEARFIKLDQTDKKDGVGVVVMDGSSDHRLSFTSNFSNESNQNDRLFTLIRPIKLNSLKDYIDKQHSNQNKGFIDEFRGINNEGDFSLVESMKPENKKKNRYANILAYDHSRVVLNTVENLDGSDYVNANYIDGYTKKAKFIATQGPVEASFADFWRMVWEQKTKTIVMVTNLIEKGRVKCKKYWPSEGDDERMYGNIKVKGLDEMELADYVIRRFSVTKLENGEEVASRQVTQYQFTSWPDHGVPLNASQLLRFVKRIRAIPSDGAGPIVTHCSAGVGRSGTYMTLDAMLDQIDKEKQVDVFGYVTHTRKQRNFLVQTEQQYIFIYNVLLEHISCGNTEIHTADIVTKIRHLNTINPGTTKTYIQEEFERLSVNLDCSVMNGDAALLPCNIPKNRFSDILPYELNRVKLWPYPDVEGSDYINASFIDGYQQLEAYILTQAPLKNTIQDFWRMVWEYAVYAIVMISSQDERDGSHCYPYWPINDEVASFGLLRVQIVSEVETENFVKREFRVSNTKSSESRVITHFMYFDWSVTGVPVTPSLIEMIGSLQKTQQVTGNCPVVIHCSNGSGRSGTLSAVMFCLERLKLEGLVDVFQTVRTMRTQRVALVQSLEQYLFIYTAIRNFLDCFSDYDNFK